MEDIKGMVYLLLSLWLFLRLWAHCVIAPLLGFNRKTGRVQTFFHTTTTSFAQLSWQQRCKTSTRIGILKLKLTFILWHAIQTVKNNNNNNNNIELHI